MTEGELDIKIVEDYIIIKKDDSKIVLDADDLKEMILDYSQLQDKVEEIKIELNKLRKS